MIRITAENPESEQDYGSIDIKVDDISKQDTFEAGKKGTIKFLKKEIVEKPSFADYLRAGLSISFNMAIDYTKSNGAVDNPKSLHYLDVTRQNEYEQSIINVG